MKKTLFLKDLDKSDNGYRYTYISVLWRYSRDIAATTREMPPWSSVQQIEVAGNFQEIRDNSRSVPLNSEQ